MGSPAPAPESSSHAPAVVVGLISGEVGALRRCLESLAGQTLPPAEVLVPYDPPCAGVTALAREFPGVRFIAVEGLDTRDARSGASREHHDALRTIGLHAATAPRRLMIEDHTIASPRWVEEMTRALDRFSDAGAVGGAIECRATSDLTWCVWLCDFGRYQEPLAEGHARFVSDANVGYRAEALNTVATAWADGYHEPRLHEGLASAGFQLYTAPQAVVWQVRSSMPLLAALRERFVWGRSYAGARATRLGVARWILAALSPLLPAVLTFRLAALAFARREEGGRLVRCLPLIFLLTSVWACGELTGYVTARPASRSTRRSGQPVA